MNLADISKHPGTADDIIPQFLDNKSKTHCGESKNCNCRSVIAQELCTAGLILSHC